MSHVSLFKHARNRPARRPLARTGLCVALTAAAAATSALVCTGTAQARTPGPVTTRPGPARVALAGTSRTMHARNTARTAATVTLSSTGDAYVSTSAPSSNYGTADSLRVTAKTGQVKTSYLRFTIPPTPGATVTDAQLVLHRTGHHLPVTTVTVSSVRGATSSESALTAANAPKTGTALATTATTATTDTVAFTVTTATTTPGTVVFALTSPVTTDVLQFASREDTTAAPQLTLTTTATPPACTVSPKLVSSCGRWLGIAAQAYSGLPAADTLAHDEAFTGADFALSHQYHTNATLFPTTADIAIAEQPGHNRVLLENWKPATDTTWAQTAAGAADTRIDAEAAYLKSHFDLPFYLTIWHEPENDINPTPGSGMTVTDYQAMYRHVILRLRADGATKFVSVMNYMGFGRWNSLLNGLYPGDDVVDWIAYDPYQTSASAAPGHDFADMVNRTYQGAPGFYTWATTTHPSKPLMLAEWGGLYNPTNPTGQADFFTTVTTQITAYPAIKALVYFDIDTKYHQINGMGTTPDSSPTSLTAWKTMATSTPFHTPTFTYTNGTITPTP